MSLIQTIIQHPVLIAYLSGANNYTWVYFRSNKKILISKSLNYFEERLPEFVRIHKTALINPSCVEGIQPPPRQKMAGSVQMIDGSTLPVSRRRWSQVATLLLQHVVEADLTAVGEPMHLPHETLSTEEDQPSFSLRHSLMVVTDDKQKTLLLEQLIQEKWPEHAVHVVSRGMTLPELLTVTPDHELPTFILIDARTGKADRLSTLRQMKADNRLRLIPIVLLVSPAGRDVEEGYALQANSVVPVPNENAQFLAIVERLCQYWLTMAALPITR